jgi:spermidine synthase
MALLVIPFALSRRGQRLRRGPIIGGAAVAGLTGMTLEVCLLFAVQVLNGHVYSQVGALVAVFMAGLAAGAYSQGQAVARRKRLRARWLGWLIAGAAVATATPLLLSALEALPALNDRLSLAAIGGLMACGGAVVGALFPLAVAMLGESAPLDVARDGPRSFPRGGPEPVAPRRARDDPEPGRRVEGPRAAGVIYAADLTGAAVGALVTAVVALPLLGLAQTCWAAALMMGAAAAISGAARSRL